MNAFVLLVALLGQTQAQLDAKSEADSEYLVALNSSSQAACDRAFAVDVTRACAMDIRSEALAGGGALALIEAGDNLRAEGDELIDSGDDKWGEAVFMLADATNWMTSADIHWDGGNYSTAAEDYDVAAFKSMLADGLYRVASANFVNANNKFAAAQAAYWEALAQ